MPDTQAEKKYVVGVCEEISEKNGWTKFSINVGRDWPLGLSTKLPALIEQGRAVGGDTATWTYKETESDNVNEKTGKPFVNRYLEKVETGEHVPAGGNTTASAAAPASGARDQAIIRQTCLKAAASLYGGLGQPVDLDMVVADELPIRSDPVLLALLRAAEQMENWVHRDAEDVPF